MAKRVEEQVPILPAIESKRHLFAVGLQVLCADSVPRADYSTLEKRECGLDGVCIDVSLCVDAQLVSDRLVSSVVPKVLCGTPVGVEVVRIDLPVSSK